MTHRKQIHQFQKINHQIDNKIKVTITVTNLLYVELLGLPRVTFVNT